MESKSEYRWYAVYTKPRNEKKVVKYVTFGGKAVAIPENQIDTIKRTLNQNLDFEVCTKRFKKGEKIEVLHGSLVGLNGEIQTISGKTHLLIRIDNIGYSLLVHIPQSNLKLIA